MFRSRLTRTLVLLAVAAAGVCAAFASPAKADHVFDTWGYNNGAYRPGYWVVDQTSLDIYTPLPGGEARDLYSNTALVCASPSYPYDQRVIVQWLAYRFESNSWTNADARADAYTVHAGQCHRFTGFRTNGYGRLNVAWKVWWQTPGGFTFAYQARELDELADYAVQGDRASEGTAAFVGGYATIG
jgi:hypothetical protein